MSPFRLSSKIRRLSKRAAVVAAAALAVTAAASAADRAPVEWVRQFGGSKNYWADYGRVAAFADGGAVAAGYDGETLRVVRYSPDGDLRWEYSVPTGNDHWPCAVDVDIEGNTYVAATVCWGVSEDGTSQYGAFLLKLDAAGNERWRRVLRSRFRNYGYAVACGTGGSVYLAGHAWGGMDGSGSYCGETDAFLTRFDADGGQRWVRQIGSRGFEFAYCLAVDDGGDVYVAGETGGSLYIHVNAGEEDIFVARFDARGDRAWLVQQGSPGRDRVRGMTVDERGDIYATGRYGGAGFLARFDPADGRRRWLKSFEADSGWDVCCDRRGGYYVTGNVTGSLYGNMHWGGSDIFVMRFRRSGSRSRVSQFGTARSDEGTGVAAAADGALYVTGNTYLSVREEERPDIGLAAGEGGLLLMKLGRK